MLFAYDVNMEIYPLPTHSRFLDLSGRKFNRLEVIAFAGVTDGRRTMWWCRCSCADKTIKKVEAYSLKTGSVKSCGCLSRETPHHLTHGLSRKREYRIWQAMIRRCTVEKDTEYHNYGGRGIKVCQRWTESVEAFFTDLGPRPSKRHMIDRKDNNKGYDCGGCQDCSSRDAAPNCHWVLPKTNARNRRGNVLLTHDGRTATIAEWSELTGIDQSTLWLRLNTLGWSVHDSLVKPVRKIQRK